MFANFANPGVFANIFLLNFQFLNLIYYSSVAKVYRWLNTGAWQTSEAFQCKSDRCRFEVFYARVEYLKLQYWKNDTIEQLQMGVSTIATALVHTAL